MADLLTDRIHPASAGRRQRANQEGRVAKSYDLTSAILLLGGISLLLYFGRDLVDFFGELIGQQLGGKAWLSADSDFVVEQGQGLVASLGKVALPLLGLLMVIAVIANMGQVGFRFTPTRLAPQLNRVSPMAGWSRLFSMNNLTSLFFGLFKIAAVLGVAGWTLWPRRAELLAMSELEVAQFAVFLTETLLNLGLRIAATLLVLGIVDYLYQRWRLERDLRMTDEELREEMRNQQGNPQIATRRRLQYQAISVNSSGVDNELRQQMATSREM